MRVQRSLFSAFVILMFAVTFLPAAGAQTASHPVTGSELLAIVAGQCVDQNIFHVIESRGIAFRPTDHYRALLTIAGADAPILDALKNAKIGANAADPEQMEAPELLQHLATAGKLIRAKQFDPAGEELAAALQSHIGPEAGFVMGLLQDKTQGWSNAAAVYSKVLEMAPDFPAGSPANMVHQYA
jgi:hypothetical protein